MGTRLSAPSAQESRFEAYMEGLAQAAEHADRHEPLKKYCKGLLLAGERKSVEPMAARLCPDNVRRAHQSLHHVVADSPWSDEALLRQVRERVLPAMTKRGPVVAWIVDDTGFPKKGKHSVGVARQYCGQVGKQDNCQVAVSLSMSTWSSSIPVAWRLYLPEAWTKDAARRKKTGVPAEVVFQTKPQIALEQIEAAVKAGIPKGVVLGDAAYGNNSEFRGGVTALELIYAVGIQSTTKVRKSADPAAGQARTMESQALESESRRVSVKELARALPKSAWRTIKWRESSSGKLKSRFAAVRVSGAHPTDPTFQEWLLIEWPKEEPEPTKYWLSSLPTDTKLTDLVLMAKHRWIVERDYQELKQELGLGHYEGRGWRGFHHHATLCIAAYGFLVSERSLFSPSVRAGDGGLSEPGRPVPYQPRGSPHPSRAA